MGKDGNIDIQIPIMLSQLGLRNVGCRVSDKVNFLDQNIDMESKNMLYSSLREEGLGQELNDVLEVLNNLLSRGLNETEAQKHMKQKQHFLKNSVMNPG